MMSASNCKNNLNNARSCEPRTELLSTRSMAQRVHSLCSSRRRCHCPPCPVSWTSSELLSPNDVPLPRLTQTSLRGGQERRAYQTATACTAHFGYDHGEFLVSTIPRNRSGISEKKMAAFKPDEAASLKPAAHDEFSNVIDLTQV